MNEIIIEYDVNGKITKVFLPNGEVFEVTSQNDHFVGGKLATTHLGRAPLGGGTGNE